MNEQRVSGEIAISSTGVISLRMDDGSYYVDAYIGGIVDFIERKIDTLREDAR
jgi:hypothetical protein